jgi:hypothetical protein
MAARKGQADVLLHRPHYALRAARAERCALRLRRRTAERCDAIAWANRN